MASSIPSHTRSQELYEQACQVLPGGVNSSLRNVVPHLVFKETRGAILVDVDGNEYIDYQAAFGPPLLGHSHPEVNRRVAEAL
ncbi:MAG: aminotransferase class III-fold pyridoxal phosphate-dependent enzyme, partial [Terriglobia bacterium]